MYYTHVMNCRKHSVIIRENSVYKWRKTFAKYNSEGCADLTICFSWVKYCIHLRICLIITSSQCMPNFHTDLTHSSGHSTQDHTHSNQRSGHRCGCCGMHSPGGSLDHKALAGTPHHSSVRSNPPHTDTLPLLSN